MIVIQFDCKSLEMLPIHPVAHPRLTLSVVNGAPVSHRHDYHTALNILCVWEHRGSYKLQSFAGRLRCAPEIDWGVAL